MQKVVVIGIDGATLDLMEPRMNEGKLPNFEKIRKNGTHGRLASTIPPFSAPAWTSIITGCNPGKHGIYGFERTDTLESHLVTSNFRKVPAMWNFLTDIDIKSIIVNVPCTFPPEKINGIIITGLLTPSPESDFTYPKSIKEKLTEKDLGNFEFEQVLVEDFSRSFLAKYFPEKLMEHINKEMTSHAKVTTNLMRKFDWNFNMIVFRGTDTAQHFLWNEKHLLLSCYQKVDQLVGEMMALFPEAVFFIVSDHGFEGVKKALYPDNVLYNAGLLKPMKSPHQGPTSIILYLIFKIENMILRLIPQKTIKHSSFIFKLLFSIMSKQKLIDYSKTKAFSTADGQGIQINKKNSYEKGIVDDCEYEKLSQEIIKLFRELKDPESKEKIVEEVYRWYDIYGKNAICPPDFVLKLKEGVYAMESIRLSDNPISMTKSNDKSIPYIFKNNQNGYTGNHAPYGIFFAYGKNIRQGHIINNLSVEDILPMVFTSLGISSPDGIDGKLREDVFSEKPIVKIVDWKKFLSAKPALSSFELKKIHELRKMFKPRIN